MAWTIFAIAPSSEHAPPLYAPLTAQGQVQRCLCFFNGTTSNTHTHTRTHTQSTHIHVHAHIVNHLMPLTPCCPPPLTHARTVHPFVVLSPHCLISDGWSRRRGEKYGQHGSCETDCSRVMYIYCSTDQGNTRIAWCGGVIDGGKRQIEGQREYTHTRA